MTRTADVNPSRTITNVQDVNVNAPVGTAPRLPYQLWVTYSDGKASFTLERLEIYDIVEIK